MKKVLFACICTVMLASCGQHSAEYKKLQNTNDSLRLENAKANSELNDVLSTIDEIESGFQSIKEAENYLNIQGNAAGEMNKSRREQIRESMDMIAKTLEKNKASIEELQKKLNQSSNKNATLQKMVNRLTQELQEKTKLIAELQEDLTKKNVLIQEKDDMITTLNEDVENLSTTNMAQSEKLKKQDDAINTAYYCFGTTKELKAQKILLKKNVFAKTQVLKDGFNKEYFIKIDIREVTEIPLFASKAKLQSNHPEGNYELVRDEDNNLTLKITDIKAFWSLSKYLVIVVG